MEIEEILGNVIQGIHTLLDRDGQLLRVDANERTLTSRLAMHLQPLFPAWDVDCEYNRFGNDQIKRLPPAEPIQTDDTSGKTIFPDVIVHHRTERDNLLILEMKKETNRAIANDLLKLQRLTELQGAFSYACGVHLVLNCDGGPHSASVYVDGAEQELLSRRVTESIN